MKLCVFFLGLALMAPHAFADSIQVGEWIHPQSALRKPIYWGETIRTQKNEFAQLVIFPAFILKVHPLTQIRVIGSLLKKDGKQYLSEGAIRLLSGSLRAKLTHPKNTRQHFSIYSKAAVFGVRGTEFIVDTEKNFSTVKVFEGKVTFQNLVDGTEKVITETKGIDPDSFALSEAENAWLTTGETVAKQHAARMNELQTKFKADIAQELKEIKDEAEKSKRELKAEYKNFFDEE